MLMIVNMFQRNTFYFQHIAAQVGHLAAQPTLFPKNKMTGLDSYLKMFPTAKVFDEIFSRKQ